MVDFGKSDEDEISLLNPLSLFGLSIFHLFFSYIYIFSKTEHSRLPITYL